jgi:formylglycine-generating enzyme required for sulfatase activity
MKRAAGVLVSLLVTSASYLFAQTSTNVAAVALSGDVSTNKPTITQLMQGAQFTNATGLVLVKISDGLWAGKYLVTQKEYTKVVGSNPSQFQGESNPVDSVSWNDAVNFCARLAALEAKDDFLPKGWAYTLPTQAQWETLMADTTLDQAFTSQKEKRTGTAPVGSLPANALGLYDARGNLWQWCLDPADKPFRVLKGAAWDTALEVNLRPVFRWYSNGPDERKSIFGFRCLLVRAPTTN